MIILSALNLLGPSKGQLLPLIHQWDIATESFLSYCSFQYATETSTSSAQKVA